MPKALDVCHHCRLAFLANSAGIGKGKIADEIIDHISALLDEEAFDLEARYEEQGGDYWAQSSAVRWVRAVVLVYVYRSGLCTS